MFFRSLEPERPSGESAVDTGALSFSLSLSSLPPPPPGFLGELCVQKGLFYYFRKENPKCLVSIKTVSWSDLFSPVCLWTWQHIYVCVCVCMCALMRGMFCIYIGTTYTYSVHECMSGAGNPPQMISNNLLTDGKRRIKCFVVYNILHL